MKTRMDHFADDLDGLARIVFVLTQPEVIQAYDSTHGRDAAVSGLGLGLNTMLGLVAAKLRSEVTEEDRAKAREFKQFVSAKPDVVGGDSDE